MSQGINRVIIMGNLGSDPFQGTLPSGQSITKISVATTRASKDKTDVVEWHNICFFDRLAEIANRYLKKGSKAFVEGYLKTSKWKDNSGVERYKTEIIGTNLQLMDSKYDNNEHEEHLSTKAVNGTHGINQSGAGRIEVDDIPF